MTKRRTVDSRAGTLKTKSNKTGKSVFTKLFSITAIGMMAVYLMSFAQKDNTASNDKNLTASAQVMSVGAMESNDSFNEVKVVHLAGTKVGKVVLSEEFVNTLRNIKLDVIKADREIAKKLYLAEVSKKEALVFYRNSQPVMEQAAMEVTEQMKEEAIKYNFFNGNADVLNEASGEVENQMKEEAVKIAVITAMKADMVNADEEVLAGLQQKSPETVVAAFMKASVKNIADADVEINNTIKVKK